MKKLLVVAMVCGLMISKESLAQTADVFQFPLEGYRVDCLGWGGLNAAFPVDGMPGKHAAEDSCVPAGTVVMSAGFGQVMFAQARGSCTVNWVYLIIIKHQLSDGHEVCTLYGHAKPVGIVEGQWVDIGDPIGEVISTSCWSDHLHFAVYSGSYGTALGQYPSWAAGYLSQTAWPKNYIEPSRFIEGYNLTLYVGYNQTGDYCKPIYDCFNRNGGLSSIGWPIDDGGGIYVHNWAPFRYLCQNFRNARGEESIIMYDPLLGSQAYRIAGKFWEYYRYGRNSRYGPDIPMDDGTVLGAPTSDFINGQQCFQNGYCKSGSVELHRLDGTLVEVFAPTGEFSALTLSGKPMSENHNTIESEGGPVCDYYAVFGNGTEIGQTTLREFTEAGLPTGSTRQYQVTAMSNSAGALGFSNVVIITGQNYQVIFWSFIKPIDTPFNNVTIIIEYEINKARQALLFWEKYEKHH